MNTRSSLLLVLMCAAARLTAQDPIFGFFPSSVPEERTREKRLTASVSESSLREFLKEITREPHHAGSPGDRRTADYVNAKFTAFGFDPRIEEFQVYLPRPSSVQITMLKPVRRTLTVREKGLPADALMPFNAYSPSCDITAEVVYANYGQPEDFRKLTALGISPRGKIVLLRYGRVFRGMKVHEAQIAGAAGVILYSDPADDGYAMGDVYPKGRMRPWDAAQRGSIRLGEAWPGDPLTPGVGATAVAQRIKPSEDPDIPLIPCTPISYAEAQHLIENLSGPVVPREWQGGLPCTYHLGPGPTRVNLFLKMDNAIRPIWNNIALLRGSTWPEQTVIFGGHRDAWVYGAQDPNSGSAVLLEAARILGEEYRRGWRPKRTLIFAQWDAEEYSMIGSTEWGEQHAQELAAHCVAYLNFDGTVSGSSFGTGGIPSLDQFAIGLTNDVIDPRSEKPLFEVWWKNQNPGKPYSPQTSPESGSLSIGRLGGGSDHVVFLNHLGIPSMGFGFGGGNGVYHSAYDNFDWMDRFGDPGFQYHGAAARMTLLAALRLADADLFPFSFPRYAEELTNQFGAIEKIHQHWLDSAGISFAGLRSINYRWLETSRELESAMTNCMLPGPARDSINTMLNQVERGFIGHTGVAGRSWYRHRIIAASGYASVGFPGISAALDRHDGVMLREEMSILGAMITHAESLTRSCTDVIRNSAR